MSIIYSPRLFFGQKVNFSFNEEDNTLINGQQIKN